MLFPYLQSGVLSGNKYTSSITNQSLSETENDSKRSNHTFELVLTLVASTNGYLVTLAPVDISN